MKTIRLLVTALLVLAFTVGPLSASNEAARTFEIQPSQSQRGADFEKQNIQTIQVGLLVEIPGSGLLFRHHISAPVGSTVNQVLASAYSVKNGVVCCDSRDIWSINGLAVDPYKEKWWIIKVNGNTQNTSSTRKLTDGDVVELVYMENAMHPVAHVRLEDWVNSRK